MAYCSQALWPHRVQLKFRCILGRRHLPRFTKSLDRLPAPASFGSRDIGRRLVIITSGSAATGSGLHLKEHTGPIRITTIIEKAGKCTKDIGTARTMRATTGVTVTTVSTSMSGTTRRWGSRGSNLLRESARLERGRRNVAISPVGGVLS